MAEELAQEGLRPVTPDQECLTEVLQTQEGKAEETLKAQVPQADYSGNSDKGPFKKGQPPNLLAPFS